MNNDQRIVRLKEVLERLISLLLQYNNGKIDYQIKELERGYKYLIPLLLMIN